MKYLYKPKKSSIYCYFIFLTIFVLLNVCFFVEINNPSQHADVVILGTHTFLPICFVVIIALSFAYILCCFQKLCSLGKESFQLLILRILMAVDVFWGILLIMFFYENEQAMTESNDIIKAIYFKGCNIAVVDLSKIYSHWNAVLLLLLIVLAVLLFVFATKKRKKCKEIKQKIVLQRKEEQLKADIDSALGFDYETSEYYQQTQISYQNLRAKDGTRGEFEAYCQLAKSNLSDGFYAFNREIPKQDGLSTEIDMIFLHRKGIIVLENKHYSTQIYGRATDFDLTIIDHSGKKKSIYNPIKQNENHVDALREYLAVKGLYKRAVPIHSVVSFTDLKSHRSNEIISKIEDVEKTRTIVCTSQNLCVVIEKLLQSENNDFFAEVEMIKKELLTLPIRKKG